MGAYKAMILCCTVMSRVINLKIIPTITPSEDFPQNGVVGAYVIIGGIAVTKQGSSRYYIHSIPINIPSEWGVNFWRTIEFVGLLPSNTYETKKHFCVITINNYQYHRKQENKDNVYYNYSIGKKKYSIVYSSIAFTIVKEHLTSACLLKLVLKIQIVSLTL